MAANVKEQKTFKEMFENAKIFRPATFSGLYRLIRKKHFEVHPDNTTIIHQNEKNEILDKFIAWVSYPNILKTEAKKEHESALKASFYDELTNKSLAEKLRTQNYAINVLNVYQKDAAITLACISLLAVAGVASIIAYATPTVFSILLSVIAFLTISVILSYVAVSNIAFIKHGQEVKEEISKDNLKDIKFQGKNTQGELKLNMVSSQATFYYQEGNELSFDITISNTGSKEAIWSSILSELRSNHQDNETKNKGLAILQERFRQAGTDLAQELYNYLQAEKASKHNSVNHKAAIKIGQKVIYPNNDINYQTIFTVEKANSR